MLDKEVFFKKMDELLMAYPNWNIQYDDPKVMKFWYSKFKHMENRHFELMIDRYIENENFNPTIGGLKSWDIEPRKSAEQIAHEKMLKEHGLL